MEKQLHFLLPILSQNFKYITENGVPSHFQIKVEPLTLILAPTRELAIQIIEEVSKFSYRSFIRACVCYGGQPVKDQMKDFQKGCQLLVATPGLLFLLFKSFS